MLGALVGHDRAYAAGADDEDFSHVENMMKLLISEIREGGKCKISDFWLNLQPNYS